MLRKVILLGVFTGSCASLPVFYELNPSAVERWYLALTEEEPQLRSQPAAPAPVPIAPTQATVEPLPGRQVRLNSDARGHFIADFKLNGRSVSAMVDTGATFVAINKSTARRIGIKLAQDAFIHEVKTANGTTKAATGLIDRIQIGRISLEDIEALILEDEGLEGVLVGMSFLGRLSGFEVQNGHLLLRQ